MNELFEQFLVEGRELVQQATDDLLALERDPADAARLDGAFRAVHTLKGSVGLFDLAPMGRVLHAAEDLLEAVRAGQLAAAGGVMDALVDAIAASEGWIEAMAAAGALPDDAPERARRLEAALRAPLGEAAPQPAAAPAGPPDWLAGLLARDREAVAASRAAGHRLTALRYRPAADCFFLGDDPMAVVRAVPGLVALDVAAREPWPAEGPDVFACNLDVTLLSSAEPEEVHRAFRFVADQVQFAEVPPAEAPPPADAAAAEDAGEGPRAEAAPVPRAEVARSLRIDAAAIDALLDQVGELIVAKNRLAHLVAEAGRGGDPRLARMLADSQAGIERLAEAMHRTVMDVRMIPLAHSFRRLPRLVRDTAARLGKQLRFEIAGEEVKADKAIVDGLYEPLLHLLRNAVDHGIEDAATRAAAGKPAAGRVTLTARRAGEGLVIEVADDGAGIDAARLRAVARQRRLMPDAAIDALGDAAARDLIFLPGFTTAAAVTSVSGRGVGMDAVRAAVAALGGRVTLDSAPGAGSVLRLVVPQGVVATNLLTVRLGEELYGVPTEAVAETARIPAGRILPLRDGEAFVLRDRTVPLLRLSALLDLAPRPRPPAAQVLVTGSGAGRVGLEVDGFAGRADVLLRPLDGLLSGTPGLLGTALLGDGRVLMVLDLPELVR